MRVYKKEKKRNMFYQLKVEIKICNTYFKNKLNKHFFKQYLWTTN